MVRNFTMNSQEEIKELRERVRLLEEENARLRSSNKEMNCNERSETFVTREEIKSEGITGTNCSFIGSLGPDQIERYSRQLLIQGGFGVEGQLKLLNSSVLIVGAGGIGSTGKSLDDTV